MGVRGDCVKTKKIGVVRESNPRPLAPEARIIPLDQRPMCGVDIRVPLGKIRTAIFASNEYKNSKLNVGWMAERSKALVSGTSLFGGVGSNPTPIIFCVRAVFIASQHETLWEPHEALPSSTGTRGLVGYDACFTRRKSRVRSSAGVLFDRDGKTAGVPPFSVFSPVQKAGRPQKYIPGGT